MDSHRSAERRTASLLLSLLFALTGILWFAAVQANHLPPRLREWVQAHPQIRFAPERDYGPFVYVGANGEPQGLSMDFLGAISARLGLPLVVQAPLPLPDILAQVKAGQTDLVSSLRRTPERAAFLAFSEPYVSVAAVLVTRRDAAFPAELAAMRGKRIAVGNGYAVEHFLRVRMPALQLEPVSDDAVALRGVASGRFDGAVADLASIAFVRAAQPLENLKVGEAVGFEYPLSFAVRKDWPELREILDIGIQSMSRQERQELLAKWIPSDIRSARDAKNQPLATLAGVVILLSVLGLLIYRWRSRRQRHDARAARRHSIEP
jgi:ABC-type amino acid transport substrate-binding protein